MKYALGLLIVKVALLFCFPGRANGTESEWRPEAHRVALEAVTKKHPHVMTQDAEVDIYRYSTSSVAERTGHAFSFLITPDKSKTDLTYRCDVIVSRYRGQVYSFVFGEPSCYQVECTEEEVANRRSSEKICRKAQSHLGVRDR